MWSITKKRENNCEYCRWHFLHDFRSALRMPHSNHAENGDKGCWRRLFIKYKVEVCGSFSIIRRRHFRHALKCVPPIVLKNYRKWTFLFVHLPSVVEITYIFTTISVALLKYAFPIAVNNFRKVAPFLTEAFLQQTLRTFSTWLELGILRAERKLCEKCHTDFPTCKIDNHIKTTGNSHLKVYWRKMWENWWRLGNI